MTSRARARVLRSKVTVLPSREGTRPLRSRIAAGGFFWTPASVSPGSDTSARLPKTGGKCAFALPPYYPKRHLGPEFVG